MIIISFIIQDCYISDKLEVSGSLKNYDNIVYNIPENTENKITALIKNNQRIDLKIQIEEK